MKNLQQQSHVARILLIDDKPEEIRLLLDSLREAQFHISVALVGMQGYGRAVAQLPDLILLDINLGQSHGFVVCRLLKADPSTAHIPIIFLSSSNTLEDKLTGLREGAVDYVVKPFEPAEVVERVRAHLRTSRPRQGLDETPIPAPIWVMSSDQVLVTAAAMHVAENLASMPTLAEIARRVGTHEKRLSRAFRHAKGVSVFEFVREQRLTMARKLLAQTPMSIADIATETGFSSAANFATAFRATAGVPPTQYRQRQRRAHPLACSEGT